MFIEAVLAATLVAVTSLIGALIFGNNKKLIGWQRYVVPTAVGVFLALILIELIPKTLEVNQFGGSLAIAFGFIAFYVLSYELHRYFHSRSHEDDKECDRKAAANLLLIGDGIHNFADGVILGAAFLVDPTVGMITAIGLALHEIPQEIVEFGVLVRGGYSRLEAALRNFLSASSIILGTIATLLLAEAAGEYVWLIVGVAAGNLLYLAAADLLPRVHDNLRGYGSFWFTVVMMVLGFLVMTATVEVAHEQFGHTHGHDHHEVHEGEHKDYEDEEHHEEEHEHPH